MIKVGIIGSTGYAGEQLVYLLLKHPEVKIEFLCSHSYANISFNKTYGNFNNFMEDICIADGEVENRLSSIDLLFIALPSGKAFDFTKKALEAGVKVIDLGADFRLKSAEIYSKWYGLEHKCPNYLKASVYSIPELHRDEIKNADLIANPGCYPTASTLALAPLLSNDLIDTSSIIIDAKSGVSGAGRKAATSSLFVECNDSIKAYGVASHRHTPEIEQTLSKISSKDVVISFTPHLIPMNRGILATCYGTLTKHVTQDELMSIYKEFYKNEYFVRIIEELPETRWVKGSNLCDISLRVDPRTNRVIVVSAIDNLMKGAAGQAVQNMNILYGFQETEGLEILPMFP